MSSKSKSAHPEGDHTSTHSKKSAHEHKSEAATPEASAADWAKQVVEHLVDAQKKWIDLTAQQNALVLKAIEEGMGFYRTAPTPALGDWARQGVEGFVEAQKRWAEVASQQGKQVYDAMRDNVNFNPSDVA